MIGAPTGITAAELDSALAALVGIDFAKVYADFKSGNAELIIGDVLLIAQVGTKDAGYFVPAAATASQWIGLARTVEPLFFKGAVLANAYLPAPHKLRPGEYSAFGHVFTGTVTQGKFTP
jgi:hypothetical protein